ncbi:MAG: FHIPEP family type III secretion protein, partial [Bdellovibrionales bacterium]|nr:FHIPEP family type III secretion protein [Bdellovibrionales bacterium]
AMRFVQGDAIAGFIITFINAVGGVSIGIGRGLSFSDAVDTFGLLTIGDGLVSILPSLLVSVCAGIIVTRVRSTDAITQQQTIISELSAQPQAIVIASIVLLALGLVPGLPLIPFVTVGLLLLLSAGWLMARARRGFETVEATIISDGAARSALRGLPVSTSAAGLAGGADYAALEAPQVLSLALGRNAFEKIIGRPEQEMLFRRAEAVWRKRLYREQGLPLPDIALNRDDSLAPDAFEISVRDEAVRRGTISSDSLFAGLSPRSLELLGIRAESAARHPLSLASGSWLRREVSGRDALKRLEVPVYSAGEYLVLESVRAFSDMIESVFGLDELKRMVGRLAERHPGLCAEVFDAGVINYAEFTDIIRRLVRERVNVRDLKVIIEGIAEYRSLNPDVEDRQRWLEGLHGFLRRVLSRKIISAALSPGGQLRMFVLSRELEEEFQSASAMWDGARSRPPIEPMIERQLRQNAETMFAPVLSKGMTPVVLVCSAAIRPAVNEFFAYQLDGRDWFRTVAFEELDGTVPVESVGVLGAERAHA